MKKQTPKTNLPESQQKILDEYRAVEEQNLSKLAMAELIELVKKYVDNPKSYIEHKCTQSVDEGPVEDFNERAQQFADFYKVALTDVKLEYIFRDTYSSCSDQHDLHYVCFKPIEDNATERARLRKAILESVQQKARYIELNFRTYQNLKQMFEPTTTK